MNLWTFDMTPWTGDEPDASPLRTQDNTTQKDGPRAGFEPAIPVFERSKAVRDLDRTSIGSPLPFRSK